LFSRCERRLLAGFCGETATRLAPAASKSPSEKFWLKVRSLRAGA